MQKEIFEQPESVVNTMRGRICFDTNTGDRIHLFFSCMFQDVGLWVLEKQLKKETGFWKLKEREH